MLLEERLILLESLISQVNNAVNALKKQYRDTQSNHIKNCCLIALGACCDYLKSIFKLARIYDDDEIQKILNDANTDQDISFDEIFDKAGKALLSLRLITSHEEIENASKYQAYRDEANKYLQIIVKFIDTIDRVAGSVNDKDAHVSSAEEIESLKRGITIEQLQTNLYTVIDSLKSRLFNLSGENENFESLVLDSEPSIRFYNKEDFLKRNVSGFHDMVGYAIEMIKSVLSAYLLRNPYESEFQKSVNDFKQELQTLIAVIEIEEKQEIFEADLLIQKMTLLNKYIQDQIAKMPQQLGEENLSLLDQAVEKKQGPLPKRSPKIEPPKLGFIDEPKHLSEATKEGRRNSSLSEDAGVLEVFPLDNRSNTITIPKPTSTQKKPNHKEVNKLIMPQSKPLEIQGSKSEFAYSSKLAEPKEELELLKGIVKSGLLGSVPQPPQQNSTIKTIKQELNISESRILPISSRSKQRTLFVERSSLGTPDEGTSDPYDIQKHIDKLTDAREIQDYKQNTRDGIEEEYNEASKAFMERTHGSPDMLGRERRKQEDDALKAFMITEMQKISTSISENSKLPKIQATSDIRPILDNSKVIPKTEENEAQEHKVRDILSNEDIDKLSQRFAKATALKNVSDAMKKLFQQESTNREAISTAEHAEIHEKGGNLETDQRGLIKTSEQKEFDIMHEYISDQKEKIRIEAANKAKIEDLVSEEIQVREKIEKDLEGSSQSLEKDEKISRALVNLTTDESQVRRSIGSSYNQESQSLRTVNDETSKRLKILQEKENIWTKILNEERTAKESLLKKQQSLEGKKDFKISTNSQTSTEKTEGQAVTPVQINFRKGKSITKKTPTQSRQTTIKEDKMIDTAAKLRVALENDDKQKADILAKELKLLKVDIKAEELLKANSDSTRNPAMTKRFINPTTNNVLKRI